MRPPKAIRLSPTRLNLLRECPRCFWLDRVEGIERPRGIFPSLPGGMDRVIKGYFDEARAGGRLPPELASSLPPGVRLYPDQAKLDLWRNWRTGLEHRAGEATLSGAIDDLLIHGARFAPFDYKTKGSMTSEEDAVKYYQTQLDCYGLLLEENGMPATDYGVLLYYSPQRVAARGAVAFETQCVKVPTTLERARQLLRDAVAVLRGPMPETAAACEYCAWVSSRHAYADAGQRPVA